MTLDFTTVALNESSELADEFIKLNGTGSPAKFEDYLDFYSNLRVVFIERLVTRKDEVDLAILKKIDADYNVTETVDPEVKERWFPLGIVKGYDKVMEPAKEFISSQGRLKYLTPIYTALLESGNKATAEEWLALNADFYHPMALAKITKLIKDYKNDESMMQMFQDGIQKLFLDESLKFLAL